MPGKMPGPTGVLSDISCVEKERRPGKMPVRGVKKSYFFKKRRPIIIGSLKNCIIPQKRKERSLAVAYKMGEGHNHKTKICANNNQLKLFS
jgi:hypothetical protein